MFKPNNKKMLTVMITVAMVFSALAILSFAAQPAYAASSMTSDPLYFVPGAATVTYITTSGASFPSGTTVYFYISSTATASGIIGSYIGSTSLAAGETDVSAAVSLTVPASVAAGSYYILASDSSSPTAVGATFNANLAVTVSSISPEIALGTSSQVAGGSITISSVAGHPFDPSSTIALFLSYPGNSVVLLSSITTGSTGLIPAGTTFTVPTNEPQGTYTVVAQETSSYSSTSYPNGAPDGITADASFTLNPTITVSVSDISGSTSSAFTITGEGFTAGSTVAASTSTSPTTSVTVGGVDAIHAVATVLADGSLSIPVTGLAAKITTTGSQTIVITTSPATPSSSFPNVLYVSNPPGVPQITVTDLTTLANNGYAGDSLSIVVLNMLASSAITVNMGPSTILISSTDANGFFSSTSGTVPNLPGGTYTVFAEITAGSTVTEYVSTSFTVLPTVTYIQTGTTPITGEYAPVGASVTIAAAGLAPNSEYAITDSGFVSSGGTGNVIYDYENSLVTTTVTTSNAIASNDKGVLTDPSGSLSVTYTISYYQLATGSNETITVSGSGLTAQSTYYYAIGAATVTIAAQSYDRASATQMVSVSVSGLIPYGSSIATLSGSQPADTYMLVLGSSDTATSPATPVYVNGATSTVSSFYTTSGSVTLTFPATDLAAGVNFVNVLYSNVGTWTTASDAIVGSSSVLGSSPGTAVGTVVPVTNSVSPGEMLQYALYDFPASTTVTYYYYTVSGKQTSTVTTDASGSANLTFAAPMSPSGTYQVTFAVTISGTTTTTTSNFNLAATLSSVSSTSPSYPTTSTTSTMYPGQNVTLYSYGLSPESYYGVYVETSTSVPSGATPLTTFFTDITGSDISGFTVSLPSLVSGSTNYIDVLPLTASSGTATASFSFTAGTFNNIFGPTFNYTTNTEYAFPTELVNFAWIPGTAPHAVGGTYGPVEVTVLLNGTTYTTFPAAFDSATGLLAGSFLAPNNNTGAYWNFQLQWTQIDYTSPVSVSTYTLSKTLAPTFELVSGAGALVVGVSNLTAVITTAINTAMKVPLKELNASVVQIDNLTVELKTAFGTMNTTLKAINASISAVESGQVKIFTDLGSISASLASVNASLVAFNGNLVTINTTLGQVQTSLSNIGTTVTANANGIALIKTDAGLIQGQIVSTNGNISTIHTALGNLTAMVEKINTNTSGFSTLEIFLIVVIVLVLITLVIAFLAVNNTNKLAKKIEEQKKQ